ncbi:hypothetical protein Taitung20_03890 [Helicobacter pylori]
MISNISITPIKNMLKSALNIHNFSFKSHTSTAIIGANGSGKSTLINTILGIREDYNVKVQNNNIPYHKTILFHNANNWGSYPICLTIYLG